jgi:hypothetical protein
LLGPMGELHLSRIHLVCQYGIVNSSCTGPTLPELALLPLCSVPLVLTFLSLLWKYPWRSIWLCSEQVILCDLDLWCSREVRGF